jgi:hypothetical protein
VIDFKDTTTMTDRSVVSACLLGSRSEATGLSRVLPGVDRRPATALGVTAPAQVPAYAPAFVFAEAGEGGSQNKQHNPMWAFRGLEPWRDPA